MSFFGDQASSKFRKRATRQLREARTITRNMELAQALTRRRAFLANFRQAQGEALAGAGQSAAGGLSIDSSAVQGTLASTRTQRNVAVSDDIHRQAANTRIFQLNIQAEENLQKADHNQRLGDNFTGLVKTAASFTSDIRLKTNIKPAGTYGPYNLYTWDWKVPVDAPTFGVIAQEVALINPEAVSMKDGYAVVHYGKLEV
jgi:hypothetical protein